MSLSRMNRSVRGDTNDAIRKGGLRILQKKKFFEGPKFAENGRKLNVLGRTEVKRQMDRVYLAPGASEGTYTWIEPL